MTIRLSGLAFMALACLSATPTMAQDEIPAGERLAFIERPPEPRVDETAAPNIFKPVVDAAIAEGGSAWIPRVKTWGPGAVIRVCFINGDDQLNSLVASHASSWNRVGANVRFSFGSMSSPRRCSPGVDADVRVLYNASNANWSRYGKDALIGESNWDGTPYWNEASLHLDYREVQNEFGRGLVIHEFGHALGLYHEHQKPIDGGCEAEFNWDRVYATMLQQAGWPREKVDSQVRPIWGFRYAMSEGIDRDSVMLYAFPASNFLDGADSYCYIRYPMNEISDGDADVLRFAYSDDVWASDNAGMNAAMSEARANGQYAVARGIALYTLPQEKLNEIAATYDSQLALGFNPNGGAETQLNDALDAALEAAGRPE